MTAGTGNIMVNNRDYKEYFPTGPLQYIVRQAFEIADADGKWDVKANLDGGGINGQAQALRMAIARALCESNIEDRHDLKAKACCAATPYVERRNPASQGTQTLQFSKR